METMIQKGTQTIFLQRGQATTHEAFGYLHDFMNCDTSMFFIIRYLDFYFFIKSCGSEYNHGKKIARGAYVIRVEISFIENPSKEPRVHQDISSSAKFAHKRRCLSTRVKILSVTRHSGLVIEADWWISFQITEISFHCYWKAKTSFCAKII